MKSPAVLNEVVDQLKLHEKWGNRYSNGNPLSQEQASQILSKQLQLSQLKNTQLIKVEVVDQDRNEAALIANRLIEVYKDSRLEPGATIDVVDRAQAAERPFAPNIPQNLFFALVTAAVAAILFYLIGRLVLFIRKARIETSHPR